MAHVHETAGSDREAGAGPVEVGDSSRDAETLAWATQVLWPGSRVWTTAARRGDAAPGAAVETYGILPGRESARYLVPLRSSAAAAAAVRLRQPLSRAAALKHRVLGLGLRSGLAQRLIADRLHVALPADPSGGRRSERDLTCWLRELLGRADVRCSVALGSPGRMRTPVLQASTPGGRVLAYAKVAWSDATHETTLREASTLRTLASVPPLRGRMPTLLDSAAWRDRRVIVQTAPRRARPGPNRPTEEHLEFLVALGAASSRIGPLVGSPLWRRLLGRMETARRAPHGSGGLELLERARRRLAAAADGVRLPLGWRHGDFVPWNTKRTARGLFVVDWERAREGEPTALDLYHFLARAHRRIDGASPPRVHASLARGAGRRWMLRYLRRIGVPTSHADLLLLAYLADTFSAALARAPGWTNAAGESRRADVAEMLTAALAAGGPSAGTRR